MVERHCPPAQGVCTSVMPASGARFRVGRKHFCLRSIIFEVPCILPQMFTDTHAVLCAEPALTLPFPQLTELLEVVKSSPLCQRTESAIHLERPTLTTKQQKQLTPKLCPRTKKCRLTCQHKMPFGHKVKHGTDPTNNLIPKTYRVLRLRRNKED